MEENPKKTKARAPRKKLSLEEARALVKKRAERRERREKREQRKEERARKATERAQKRAPVVAAAIPDTEKIFIRVFEAGRDYETGTTVKMKMRKPWTRPNPNEVRSFIPGSILTIFVQEGDEVKKDQELMVYEAMKMHNMIRAPFDGKVLRILAAVGEKLPRAALMMEIEPSIPPEEGGAGAVEKEIFFEDFE